jgi:hypothetical protein
MSTAKLTSVTVCVERTIKVGTICRVNTSYGYLGLDSGEVEVKKIVPTSELPKYIDLYAWEQFQDDPSDIQNWQWVGFQYTDPKQREDDDHYEYFPVEEFADHMSQL